MQLPEVERVVGWPEVAAIARAAEDGGLDSVWVGDHLLYRDPDRGPLEAWTQLAALAAVTERVTLGPLVACLAFHPPLVLAKMAATVDEISGGPAGARRRHRLERRRVRRRRAADRPQAVALRAALPRAVSAARAASSCRRPRAASR